MSLSIHYVIEHLGNDINSHEERSDHMASINYMTRSTSALFGFGNNLVDDNGSANYKKVRHTYEMDGEHWLLDRDGPLYTFTMADLVEYIALPNEDCIVNALHYVSFEEAVCWKDDYETMGTRCKPDNLYVLEPAGSIGYTTETIKELLCNFPINYRSGKCIKIACKVNLKESAKYVLKQLQVLLEERGLGYRPEHVIIAFRVLE